MCVDLSSGNVHVPQHGLHGPQIRSSIEQMGGKGMPQGMGINFATLRTLLCISVEQLPEPLTRERLGRTGEKEIRTGTAFEEQRSGETEISKGFLFGARS